jgi:YidC/Oxa1 family membrane protein insertase
MNQNKAPIPIKQLVLFMIISVAAIVGWNYVQDLIWPRPKQLPPTQQRELREHLALLAALAPTGAGLGDLHCYATNEIARQIPPESRIKALAEFLDAKKKEGEAKRVQQPKVAPFKPDLIELGNKDFNLQVRLTNKGGGVDRVIVTHFPEADQYGKEVMQADGKPQPLRLIPSVNDIPEVERQNLPHELTLPSFLIYHYAFPDELRPENLLGEMAWKIGEKPGETDRDSDRQQASFWVDVPELGVKITKTFSLERGHYHIGLSVKIEKLPGATPKPFRYQLTGGHGIPIEGVWYTSTYRNFIAGWVDKKGGAKRHIDMNAAVHTNLGSERLIRGEGTFQYAALAGQYFASATCIDDQQENKNFIEYIRATNEGMNPKDLPDKSQLSDLTPRVISEPLTLGDAPVEHKFLLYHGPVKVRLLNQLRGDLDVPSELVDRYEKTLNLRTLTDYQSDSFLGRFANFIWWTDITIFFTNTIHSVLGFLQHNLGVAALAIIAVTLLVRGALTPLSRKQAANMQKLQDKMKILQPQLKRLEEEYRGRDAQDFQRAKMKLMLDNGVNPAAQLGGCLMLILQMPIFMGLYYCLQENVFFRLQPFLWAPSLAAPDMLVWWTEKIPYVSEPASLGSMLYLGPYFNILPILAVTLMIVQQKFTMPPATDENQAMQQKMMKYMMIFMAVFFYKVASGLVIYFIISTLWGLAERKLLPKKKSLKDEPPDFGNGAKRKHPPDSGNGARRRRNPDKPSPEEKGWLSRKWGELLDAAEKK